MLAKTKGDVPLYQSVLQDASFFELLSRFDEDLAAGAEARAEAVWGDDHGSFGGTRVLDGDLDTYWAPPVGDLSGALILDLPDPTTFDVVRLQEPVTLGQRVARYRVEAWVGGAWTLVAAGTTIGYKKLDRLPEPVTTSRVRLVVEESRAEPLIAEIGLYLQPSGIPAAERARTRHSHIFDPRPASISLATIQFTIS